MFISATVRHLNIGDVKAVRSIPAPGGWIVTQEIACTDRCGTEIMLSLQFEIGSAVYNDAVMRAKQAEQGAA